MAINKIITSRRLELGLSDAEVAERAGILIMEYYDIEHYDDEFATAVEIHNARLLCKVLGLNFCQIAMDIIASDQQATAQIIDDSISSAYIGMTRDKIISSRRHKLSLSEQELADAIGFEVRTICAIENDENFLECWSIDLVISLARELKLPPLLLLRC
jgi:transcriptional regulator with XRE-family HTH domain